MSPALPIMLLTGVVLFAYLGTLGSTALAATNDLKFEVSKIQIYRLKLNQPIVFRIWVQFVNLSNTDIIIQHLYAEIYLDFDGTPQRIGTLHPSGAMRVPANSTVDMAFDIEVKWLNVAGVALQMFKDKVTGQGQVNFPDKATIEGQIKAENISIPFNYVVDFSAEPIEKEA